MTPEDNLKNLNIDLGDNKLSVPPAPLEEKKLSGIEAINAAKISEYNENEKDKPDPELPKGEPNVRLARSRQHDALPSGRVNIGQDVSVIIPKKAQQLTGFFAEDAGVLVHQFPQYKFIQEKGSANDQQATTQ